MTNAYLLSHLSDAVLLRNTSELVARDRVTTAELLAHMAEVDARMLYLPAVSLLAPHLTTGNAHGLLKAAVHKSKAEIELLLAERFPRSELLPLVEVLPSLGAECSVQLAPGQVGNAAPRSRVAPIASQRFALQLSVGQSVHDKLCHAQALLSHQIPSGDLAEVFERALDALIREAEKEKYAVTNRPQRATRASKSARHIPSRVKRAVRERDQDQCTFTSESGA